MENDFDEWKEIRARVDSIANAVFLIAGGALSLSITVVLSNLDKFRLAQQDVCVVQWAWGLLLLSIVLALTLKIVLVLEKFLLLVEERFMNKHFMKFNYLGWVVGLSSFVCFCGGLGLLALSASRILASSL